MERSRVAITTLILIYLNLGLVESIQTWNCTSISSKGQCNILNQNFTTDELNVGAITPNLTGYYFITCSFDQIFPNLFVNSPQLATLYISMGTLSALKPEDFKGANKFNILNFYNVSLASLPNSLFQYSPNLVQIVIKISKIASIGKTAFSGLKSLQSLSVSQSYLQALEPGTLDDLISLVSFEISASSLSSIPANFFQYNTKLVTVNLYSNKLVEISNGIFDNLKNLNTLSLNNNNIKTTDNLNFMYIYLYNNQLNEFYIGDQVKFIDLRNNQLKRLKCGGILKTTEANLAYNNLTNLFCIRNMVNLTNLDVSFNSLRQLIRKPFRNMTKMWYLKVLGNPLKKVVRPMRFQDLKQLISLDASVLFNYRNLRNLFPKMTTLTLETMTWSCNRTTHVSNVLKTQKINIKFQDEYSKLNNFTCRIPSSTFNAVGGATGGGGIMLF